MSRSSTGSTLEALTPENFASLPGQVAGLLIQDVSTLRLLEGIVKNLDLTARPLTEADLQLDRLLDCEIIVADEASARRLRPVIEPHHGSGEEINPALIVLVPGSYTTPGHPHGHPAAFDAVLSLSDKPALLAAQLGVALYAHRAFARRYASALEELNLNRNIFKFVSSGISIANAQLPDLPLMYVNPAFEVMTGYCLEEVLGKNCRFLQNDERDQPGLTLIREAIAQRRETVAVIRNFRKDGTFFWNELSLSPIRNREGEVTHFVGIQNDVTERVEFETALRESEKLAAVGRLASTIAHEINNPLEAVMNLLYLAQHSMPTTPEAQDATRYLAQADLELQRIKLITAQSLRFYKQSNSPEAITCSTLLDPILDIYTPRFANYSVTVTRRERSTQHIVCLASEIRQVLSNLVTNAIDAMQNGGGQLSVRTREATDWRTDTKGVVITIADTGKGMSREVQSSIYKAFYTTKGASGTGLGLWISSEIVQRHRGCLRVRSRQSPSPSGTVFQLFLPFQGASGADQQATR